jgi:hypothetical protein
MNQTPTSSCPSDFTCLLRLNLQTLKGWLSDGSAGVLWPTPSRTLTVLLPPLLLLLLPLLVLPLPAAGNRAKEWISTSVLNPVKLVLPVVWALEALDGPDTAGSAAAAAAAAAAACADAIPPR